MASALYTDVKRKPETSVFTRPEEGLFGLREWEDEGFVPEVAQSSPVPVPVAPTTAQPKRIRSPGARVIKKPKRFANGQGLEQYDDILIEDCGLVRTVTCNLTLPGQIEPACAISCCGRHLIMQFDSSRNAACSTHHQACTAWQTLFTRCRCQDKILGLLHELLLHPKEYCLLASHCDVV